MIVEEQLLFFFSAIGAFNGLFLSVYFAFFVKHKSRANYFLAALLLAVSVRVTKSVFLIFYPGISNVFIQVGLSACALIGPFLYLYVKTTTRDKEEPLWRWLLHVVPVVIIMTLVGYFHPYWQNRTLWRLKSFHSFGWVLYAQWLIYIVVSFGLIRQPIKKLFTKQERLTDKDIWLTTIVTGVAIIWLAYNTVYYTSYIVGALSFSFVFYLLLLLWFFKRRKSPLFFEEPVKYANKKISPNEARTLATQLAVLFREKEVYKDPALKLSDVARRLEVSPHYLSQYLNDNLGKSFSTFLNEHRVSAAEAMVHTHHQITLEAIGNECGFKSKSSFYTAFKKCKGVTPAQFKKTLP